MSSKLREAVSRLVREIEDGMLVELSSKFEHDLAKSLLADVKSALVEPVRNCDVGSEQEQQDRFREFCRHYESKGECGIGRYEAACPAFQGGRNPDCSLWWSQMPYESGVKE